MLTAQELENVLSLVRLGSGLRAAIESHGKQLDQNMQNWFLADLSRASSYAVAKEEFEASKK